MRVCAAKEFELLVWRVEYNNTDGFRINNARGAIFFGTKSVVDSNHYLPGVYFINGSLTADVSTEGADRKFSVLGCFQRIPHISVSSSPIHIKTK
jgi:hypothetical protein